MYVTDYGNNIFFAFLFLGAFYLDADTIWLMWMSNLSDVPMPACIIF